MTERAPRPLYAALSVTALFHVQGIRANERCFRILRFLVAATAAVAGAGAAAAMVVPVQPITILGQPGTNANAAEHSHGSDSPPLLSSNAAAAAGAVSAKGAIQWTAAKVAMTCALFVFAGLAGVLLLLRCCTRTCQRMLMYSTLLCHVPLGYTDASLSLLLQCSLQCCS